ncbi:MAG: DUF1622 domain-containing protein [Desulfobulbaceae bacterium]|nr:DUF1622 domain-containing protein [Desulfobulbaceae bacterium]
MNDIVKPIAEWCAIIIEILGIGIVTFIALYALFHASIRLFKKGETREAGEAGEVESIYQELRERLGRGILLGLEFLIAADIIHTVAVELTFETVGVLAIVVLIRTFLSFALEVELNGRWPWQEMPPGS